ncbi:5-formyltetrahydrofolate cyclo-ligase [Streptomyces sp. 3MP-14]|uniref:5-formyltetrahydrofolate cyclo-ligase n=1 Tax=Streptomyces mimosae TaxID=2586635 RepID=A0A5N6A8I1_9ACTN|nr:MULTISPECIES: 5-formyltetrahydrofolate cyclo-ligase [Streptomyces]KAB8164256.1 5-formyltetrahydrofolate cyclo-ligase [Streptomyces mimosae]KAB8176533.1 5-formyltetrahydrofolate cyclo-ligase [Streptomyces sp. 3MP-14]
MAVTDSARLKRALRRDLSAVRAALADDEVAQAAEALAERALELPELAEAGTVAAYVSVGREPGTGPLLRALRERGVQVLLPVLLADNDLDWAEFEGHGRLVEAEHAGRVRLLEPSGRRLGPDAVTWADTVLLPGLAVDGRGVRMGRGGGSYDRALARLAESGADPALVALVYGHEVVDVVPDEPHDRRVHAALTPEGVHRFTR